MVYIKQSIHRKVDLEEIQGSQIIIHDPYMKKKRGFVFILSNQKGKKYVYWNK